MDTQIIEKILSPIKNAYAAVEERSDALKWELAFVRMGGLSYLLEVLISWHIDTESSSASLQKTALSALIRRVSAFMPPVRERHEATGGNGQDGGEADLILEESDEEYWQEARGEHTHYRWTTTCAI